LKKPVELVETNYGNRVRVRVCGICLIDEKILLVNHQMYPGQDFWSFPGGGINFGEKASEALQREITEETGFGTDIGSFLFVNEFVSQHLHAVELFFQAVVLHGELVTGIDPEFGPEEQIIKDVRFMTLEELSGIENTAKHSVLGGLTDWNDLLNRGSLI
jgi:8-oxo-dGTP diphosphatase